MQKVESAKDLQKPSGGGADIHKMLKVYTKEFLAHFEQEKLKDEMELGTAVKELAKAIKDQPQQGKSKPISKPKKRPVKEYVRTQATDWDNELGTTNLTRNQTKPWSHVLNAFPKDLFANLLENPTRFRLVYNAS